MPTTSANFETPRKEHQLSLFITIFSTHHLNYSFAIIFVVSHYYYYFYYPRLFYLPPCSPEAFACDYIRRKPLLLLLLLSLSILFAPIFTRGICLRLYSSQAITITIVASYVCTVCFTVQFYRSRHRTSFLCIYDLHIQCFTRLHHASQVTDSLSLHVAL